MAEHEVVIAGAGPTGMMLAAELTLAGTDVLSRFNVIPSAGDVDSAIASVGELRKLLA